jgi:hypothetical protein
MSAAPAPAAAASAASAAAAAAAATCTGGKILAMSTATALAAPFEGYFFQGVPLTSADVDESRSENVLAWSGMRYEAHQVRKTPFCASL